MLRFAAVPIGIMTFLAAPAAAQIEAPARGPVFVSAGAGAGSYDCGCTSLDPGVAGQLLFGGFVSQRVLMGLEVTGWLKEQSRVEYQYVTMGLATQLYPVATMGLFFRASLGIAALDISGSTSYLSNPNGGTGFGLGAGVGYDIGLVERLAVTPYALFSAGRVNRGVTHVHAGLAITFR